MQTEISRGAADEHVVHRIERNALNGIVMPAKDVVVHDQRRLPRKPSTYENFTRPSRSSPQIMTVLSAPPDANNLPFLAYATQYTRSLCPLRDLTRSPSAEAYTCDNKVRAVTNEIRKTYQHAESDRRNELCAVWLEGEVGDAARLNE